MSAIQPKLVEASKEVDSSMAYVDKEQTEVSDLEKVVKGIKYCFYIKNSNNIILSSNLNKIHALVLLFLLGEDSLVNEKKKIVESIRHDCENELTEVSLAFSKTVLVDCVLINGFKA